MLTLCDLIHEMKGLALESKVLHDVKIGSVYQLSNDANAKFPTLIISQRPHIQSDDDFIEYRFWLFYVERNLDNDSNQLVNQSYAIQWLQNYLIKLEESVGGIVQVRSNKIFTTFSERFAQQCSGAYVECSVVVPVNTHCDW